MHSLTLNTMEGVWGYNHKKGKEKHTRLVDGNILVILFRKHIKHSLVYEYFMRVQSRDETLL